MPSLTDIYYDALLYAYLLGSLYLILFILSACVFGIVRRIKGPPSGDRTVRWLLFLISLFMSGLFYEEIWHHAVWGRLYTSTDYVFDFLPYFPITQARIDAAFGEAKGKLISVTMNQLRIIWLMFAIAAWATTWALYRCFLKLAFRGGPVSADTSCSLRIPPAKRLTANDIPKRRSRNPVSL